MTVADFVRARGIVAAIFAISRTIEYSELMDIDALKLLYNRADMIPIEVIRKRLYRNIEVPDEQLDEIFRLAETLCN